MVTNVICGSKCIDWTSDSKHHDLRFIKKNAVFIGKQSNLYCTKPQIKQLWRYELK